MNIPRFVNKKATITKMNKLAFVFSVIFLINTISCLPTDYTNYPTTTYTTTTRTGFYCRVTCFPNSYLDYNKCQCICYPGYTFDSTTFRCVRDTTTYYPFTYPTTTY
ncbi:unnamed protein product [Brachionus calyciflorus]|uniref:Uncharacterized protein n=1 Tax=Brachionus calyciflorus TaxID=104777 RepID=A0A814GCL7_9BILA|nr:unnamed protein product [Brachionus calyciflorus]